MNTRRCLKIAGRINAVLVRELGQGVDPARMAAEPLYARDVLLVCEGLAGGEAPELAAKFRAAMLAGEAEGETRAGTPSGFSPSRFLNSLFGHSTGSPASTLDASVEPKRHRSWFGRDDSGRK